MNTAYDILEALGRRKVAGALGVGITAVGNAASDGTFPANWFAVITEMCREEGIQCSPNLFRMRRAAPPDQKVGAA